MNPLTIAIAALIAASPAPPHAVAADPSLCFRTMTFRNVYDPTVGYTHFQIPIPCSEMSTFAEAEASARLLSTAAEGRVPLYFARCSRPTPLIGCQSNRLGTRIIYSGRLEWDGTPIGYVFDPARERPVGSKVLIECYESYERHESQSSYKESTIAYIWHYLVADDPSDAAGCQQYYGSGSYTGRVIGYVYPVETAGCAPRPTGLSHWWRAEGDAADVVNNLNGTAGNGVTFGDGKVGQAFYLDGSAGHIALPSVPYGGAAELTVSAWVKPAAGGEAMQAIFSSTETAFVHLQLSQAGNIVVYTDAGVVTLPNVSLGSSAGWTHLTLSVKPGETVLYVNGAEHGRSTMTFTTVSATQSLRIGSGYQSGRNFKGGIDEIQLYTRALSAAEIESIYAAGSGGVCAS